MSVFHDLQLSVYCTDISFAEKELHPGIPGSGKCWNQIHPGKPLTEELQTVDSA